MARSTTYTGTYTLPFEQPVIELEKQITALEGHENAAAYAEEAGKLRESRDSLLAKMYRDLSAWDTVRVARHPGRPQTSDYIEMICRDFCELHGDRRFGDDPAIISGFARIGPHKVMLIGHQKGKTTQERLACHFGCAHPEGYRKALLKMRLAEKYGLPVVTLVDTPGAYPGVTAEERGQAEAIATNLLEMSRLQTPVISVIIGEGGSGGALGIAVGDRVAMLRNAWYSVISPEGCAAILWGTANEENNATAAKALALTAHENLHNGLIDAVIDEPVGGAHRHPEQTAAMMQEWIIEQIRELKRFKPETLVRRRYEKLRTLGHITERTIPEPEATGKV